MHRLKLPNWPTPIVQPYPAAAEQKFPQKFTSCSPGVHLQLTPIIYAPFFLVPGECTCTQFTPWLRLCLSYKRRTEIHPENKACEKLHSNCRFLSVCPSVRLSVKRVHCDKTEEKSVQIFIPCERSFIPVFWEKKWMVGDDPFYLKFWVNRPALERNRRFWTNNRS